MTDSTDAGGAATTDPTTGQVAVSGRTETEAEAGTRTGLVAPLTVQAGAAEVSVCGQAGGQDQVGSTEARNTWTGQGWAWAQDQACQA